MNEDLPAIKSIIVHTPEKVGAGAAQIKMQAYMQSILIDRKLKAWELVALFHGRYRPRLVDYLYRAVRTGSRINSLCGWASWEHESFAESAPDEDGQPRTPDLNATRNIRAVHISTTELLYDGLSKGCYVPWHRAYNVLFVRRKHDNVYERLGVGVLIGREASLKFQENGLEDIMLE